MRSGPPQIRGSCKQKQNAWATTWTVTVTRHHAGRMMRVDCWSGKTGDRAIPSGLKLAHLGKAELVKTLRRVVVVKGR